MLLFDGLDELQPERRSEVAERINELMDTHRNCRFVVTCRGPVYHGEFEGNLSSQLEVAELSDQQIIAFLRPWQQSFPNGKTVEQLMQTLREKPPIMRLARNPLLLTIVALLYQARTHRCKGPAGEGCPADPAWSGEVVCGHWLLLL